MDKIAVLDFGGQYAHLIANRIRRLGVYSEILDNETKASDLKKYKGIILSGGPMSVNSPEAPMMDQWIFDLGIPILGICYGHQLTQHLLGDKKNVASHLSKEYGAANLMIRDNSTIFKGLELWLNGQEGKGKYKVWMSHGDSVQGQALARGFTVIGDTDDSAVSAVHNKEKNIYGVQFHPEVKHTEIGDKIFGNFLFDICKASRSWNIKQFIKDEMEKIKEKVGDKKVFLLVSGGVDSTVCFALLEKALGPDRVYGMLVDTGLMRYQEAEEVKKALEEAGFKNLHVAKKGNLFLEKLKGVSEPEAKRKIIGDLFWEVKESVAQELGLNPEEWIMGQGTIYPDTIETGGTKHADKIKTHHNRVDLVQEMIAAGKVIEPIAELYKDEVRELGEELGLPKELVWRQPFPGPGLGVRLLCTSEVELQAQNDLTMLDNEIEAFVQHKFPEIELKIKVLPIKSVGVQGDERTYAHPAALFTAERDWERLEKISTVITNNFPQVNRVMLSLKGGQGNFQLKLADINISRVELLQKIDHQVTRVMAKTKEDFNIWQFPVVLVPTSSEKEKESIVLRPIVSTEAMTASFAQISQEVLLELVEKISTHPEITHIFYDLTHKPPGTIEWE